MPRSTRAISHRCRDFACASFLLEVLSLVAATDQRLADKNFALFKSNPHHPSLGFRRKGSLFTAEIGRSYRALARERGGDYYWFWIGTHEEYNHFRF